MSLDNSTELDDQHSAAAETPPSTTEVEQETQEVGTEAPGSDADAFEAGFAAVNSGESEPAPEPEPARIAGYTEEELRALLDKTSEVDRLKASESKLFGSLGALRQAVDALKSQPRQSGAALQGKLTRLAAEYPEMAELLADDLREALTGAPTPSADVHQVVSEQLQATSRQYESKLLSVMHPDWKSIPASAEFAQWKGTLTPDELHVVNDSWDALAIGEVLTRFKNWKGQTQKTQQQRQSRLAAAVTPKGARQAQPAMSDSDAFVAGFNAVRGR